MASTPTSWSPAATVSAPARVHPLRSILPYLFVGFAALLYLFPFMRVLASGPDDGVSEYGAQAVLQGAIPGRDFIELYAPGAYYWLALFFRLFGTSILVARGFLLAEGVATVLLMFYLARRLGGIGLLPAAFVLFTDIPLGLLNTPHHDANLFALLSFSLFLAAERRLHTTSNPRNACVFLFVSGAVAGCTSCIMQQKGLLFVVAFALSLVLLRVSHLVTALLCLVGGFTLPILAGLAFYAARGALPDLIYANFVLPASLYNHINAAQYGFPLWDGAVPGWFHSMRALVPLPVAVLLVILLAAPLVFVTALPVLVPVLGYFHRSLDFRPAWLPYWLAAFALWASELHRLDLGHLRNGSWLLALLFFTLCEKSRVRLLQQFALAVAACLVPMGVGLVMSASFSQTLLHGRRGDFLGSKPDKALQFLMEHTRPGEDVFVYPYRPLYYFFAGVHNPTRLNVYLYDPAADNLFREAVRDLDRQQVRYVLWDTAMAGKNLTQLFPAYHEPPPDRLIIEPYLRAHYHQIAFENGFHILERNE